ncbi:MAG TPA: hypothetical protein VEW04_06760 [Allosphingosinicella sp.]|nr:hypothetical protein [Allosphingosinicella sp.]
MREQLLVAILGLALAGCGDGSKATANEAQADATAPRPVPCSVERHGMGAVIGGKPGAPCDDSVDPQTLALDALIRIIPDQHPSFYYVLAQRLFAADRRDEAVFWFYAGQLRYRIRLSCHPDLRPDTEPALFGSLHETVGRPINEYGFGDLPALIATLERVLAWDAETRNGFEPKAACASQIAEQREGLGQLIRQLRDNGANIRRDRAANGLPNR